MKVSRVLILAIVLSLLFLACADHGDQAERIIEGSGVKGGLVVHVGCGDGVLTSQLRHNDSYLVHGLDANTESVETAGKHIKSLGLYGKVSVAEFDGSHLPYTDGVVNLIVSENLGDVSMDEVSRVLAPNGVAYVKSNGEWKKTLKDWPEDIDEWTHYLHGADNNAVGQDRQVSIPNHVQWIGDPQWARHHNFLSSTSSMVTSGGRMFAIMDEGPAVSLLQPASWSLTARDAFSGVVLWKREVGPWEGILRPFRSGPAELSRRLVAVGDRVYTTLGYHKPVVSLDAATGETVRVYEQTSGAVEILHESGVLYIVLGTIDADEYEKSRQTESPSPAPREKGIIAIQAESGEILWKKSGLDTRELLPSTICVSRGRVYFNSPNHVIAVAAESGDELWKVKRLAHTSRPSWSTATLVVAEDVVLAADCLRPEPEVETESKLTWTVTAKPKRGDESMGELVALSADDGSELWRCPTAQGYNSPPDVFVVNGLVWASYSPGRNDVDFTVARDLHTGEIKKRLRTEAAFTETHHHRCYRNKATQDYILLGRTGVEFIDLSGVEPQRHCWIRGACQYGVMPANGLIYLPPHSCACYIQSKLSGLWAVSADKSDVVVNEDDRLFRGPAFDKVEPQQSGIDYASEWPTYRYDLGRTSRSSTTIGRDLNPSWEADIGGRLSGLVIGDGTALVAAIDEHTIHAFDAVTGEPKWSYTAGGRVDSPPTIHAGTAIFGCLDGYVYSLRLSDGALIWRFRAAPIDRRTVVYGQIESVWPVTGSVLVRDGTVYCTAGRSSFLDGGMTMFRLDAVTGEEVGRKQFFDRDPVTGAQPEAIIEDTELPGALPDVLVDDGTYLYLRDKRMDPDGTEHTPTVAHLFSSAGLLDDAWWHRTYWTWGERHWGRASGWAIQGKYRPSGRILVPDETTVFGYGRAEIISGGNSLAGYHLFQADKVVRTIDEKLKNNNKALVKYMKPAEVVYHWRRGVPIVVRAMLIADDQLVAAGPVMPENGEPDFDDPNARASIMILTSEDGETVTEVIIDSQPVFDGMAVAKGRLYLSTVSGKVICLSGRDTA